MQEGIRKGGGAKKVITIGEAHPEEYDMSGNLTHKAFLFLTRLRHLCEISHACRRSLTSFIATEVAE